MSLSQHYPQAQKLSLRLQHELAVLEGRAHGGGGAERDDEGGAPDPRTVEQLEGSVAAGVDDLDRRVQHLENLVHREPPSRREMWRGRVERLAHDALGFRASVDRHWQRMSRAQRERRARNELLAGASGPDASGTTAVDAYLKEAESLERSKAYVGQLREFGTDVLRQMNDQGDVLKNARRKVWDVANTLGLSNSLMRLIQRRERGDSWIVYGGMAATSGLLFGLYYFYLRPRSEVPL